MRLRSALPLALCLLLAACGSQPSSQHTQGVKPAGTEPVVMARSAVAVTIDNAPGAWPQAGIDKADLVFEFPAEGGITRYLAVFWQQNAAKIGPVRSTRIYFDDVAAAYGWPLAHAGGNVDALNAIPKLGIQNIDQIYGSGAYFWRATDRTAPHNLYTSTADLEKAVSKDGYKPAVIPAFTHGRAQGQATTGVEITYADQPNVWVYQVGWKYQNGHYQRSIDGNDVVTQSGASVRAQNVVIVSAQEFSDPDPYTPGSIDFTLTNGSGWLLQGGKSVPIHWTFSSGFSFLLQNGQNAPFAKGNTWVEVVPTGTTVSFTPAH